MDITKDFLTGQAMKGLQKGRVHKDECWPIPFQLLERLGSEVSLVFFGVLRVQYLVDPSTKRVGFYGGRIF